MSLQLVDDALELLDSDIGLAEDALKKTTKTKTAAKNSSNKRKKMSTQGKKQSVFQGKKVSCVLDEIKSKIQKKDDTKTSLKFLKRIDSTCSSSYLKQVQKLHAKALEQKHSKAEAKEESKSVFTEADFKKLKSHHFKTPRHHAFNRKRSNL
ncbi:active regulator of SIRT1 [Hyalella azteca]|uniref:Active regulator of SIRT1 n=1 Tax=Hyalella azteca TaxID=294128 RepID=A0A8B7NYK3_HYAAZ|nr:active regulator of SIRT1 [Hyalella azteca]